MTLSATAFLLLVAAWAGVVATHLQAYYWEAGRRQEKLLKEEALKVASLELIQIAEEWNPEETNWDIAVKDYTGSGEVEIIDHGSKMNLNYMNQFILGQSELKGLFIQGNAETLQQHRFSEGPFVDLSSYQEYFSKETLEKYFTVQSSLNVNTSDEYLIEKLADLRKTSGSSYREKVRQLRLSKKVLKAEDFDTFLGIDKEILTPFWTTVGELNLNTCEPLLLHALITYPAWAIPQAEGHYQNILDVRRNRQIKITEIPTLLGVQPDHLILPYFSVKSSVVEARIKMETSWIRIVLYKSPSKGESNSVRILEQEIHP